VGLAVNVVDMPETVAINLTECSFGQWDYGVQIWNDNSTVAGVCELGHFLGNLTSGLFSDSLQPIDARQSWWGAVSGPSGVGPGEGDGVSNNVLFDPWVHGPVGLSLQPASGNIINCEGSVTLTAHYVPHVIAEPLRGFELYVDSIDFLTFSSIDIVDSGILAAIGDHHFEVVDEDDGSVSIADALMGSTPGLESEATITFHGSSEGVATVGIPQYTLRDLDNHDIIASDVQSAAVEVDCTAPGAVSPISAEPGHQKATLAWTASAATDVAEYEVWRGMRYVTTPGVSAYPRYSLTPGYVRPTRPASRADAVASQEWVLAGTVLEGTEVFIDTGDTTRGIYDYEIFARDHADNFSMNADTGLAATNYWLGDFTYDGYVDIADLSFLVFLFRQLSRTTRRQSKLNV